ncbi:MAG: dehydratase [Hyphomonadaceae bacterium]|nr:MAG: MaoC-like dehydratase [Caulobacteraceae bacterium]MBT9447229.1 dehydratase [Hyphomonadaceae bacterium]TPW02232.1 MAG: MaoC-like dehydratase [Alphaproteobacteria bacterium]
MTDAISIERTLTQDEFLRFAALSGDDNAIHVSPEFAARTRFGRTVAHGVFLLSILRGLADQLLPGARQISQKAMFPAPTYAGDQMVFTATVSGRNEHGVEITMSAVRRADEMITCEALAVFAP